MVQNESRDENEDSYQNALLAGGNQFQLSDEEMRMQADTDFMANVIDQRK